MKVVLLVAVFCLCPLGAFRAISATEPFRDDFTGDTMSEWEIVDVGTFAAPSKWFIADGALHQASNIYTRAFNRQIEVDWTGTFLISRKARFTDGLIDTTFWSTDDDGIGVVWRYRNQHNYYKFQIDSSGKFWQISKTVAGKFTCLAVGRDKVYTKGRRHGLQVRVHGATMAVYLDGELLGAAEDDALADGSVGFESRGNSGSHFEHLRVTVLDGGMDVAAVEARLLGQAVASLRLTRLAVLPGEELMIGVRPGMGERVRQLRTELRAPSGRVLAETRLQPRARQRVWKNSGAAPGLYRLVVLRNDQVLRELPFNVWQQVPRNVGVCAHRGDSRAAPENTLPAFALAVRKGAHQIEFDVRMSKDGRLIVMHDATLDRTTNGTGPVANHTFAELRKLDAGSWKGAMWKGTRIPTFREVLEAVPPSIQLNCHLRPGVAARVARQVVELGRVEQCFLACGRADAVAAKRVDPRIRICNMQNQGGPDSSYPDETIALGAEYIQIYGWHDCLPAVCAKLRAGGVTINNFGTSDPAMFRRLIEAGVQFPLTDDLDAMIPVLRDMGVPMAAP